MCIFANPVADVADTNIYVGVRNGTQFTAYQMTVDLIEGRSTAMILPVPSAAKDVNLINLSGCPDLFKDLNDMFPLVRSRGIAMKSFSLGNDDLNTLAVHEIGSYQVSIAPAIEDIDRANPDVFTLDSNVKDTLNETYSFGYCFLICQLVEGGQIHPLGYTNPVAAMAAQQEFMFVPTRHEHGDGYGMPVWNHSIYYQGKATGPVTEPGKNGWHRHVKDVRSALGDLFTKIPTDVAPFFNGGGMHRMRYHGRRDNIDLLIVA